MPPKKLVIKDDGTADFGALESVVSTQLAADAKYEQARCMLTHTAHSDAPHTHTHARARARAPCHSPILATKAIHSICLVATGSFLHKQSGSEQSIVV
jgi:hypothetical protein